MSRCQRLCETPSVCYTLTHRDTEIPYVRMIGMYARYDTHVEKDRPEGDWLL